MEEVVANIRSALISSKGSTNIQQLQKDYKDIVGEPIPLKKLGFTSLENFLTNVPSIKVSKLPNGETRVDAVATDNVKHIVNLVQKQKTKTKASKKKVKNIAKKSNAPLNKSLGYNSKTPSSKPVDKLEAPKFPAAKVAAPNIYGNKPDYGNQPPRFSAQAKLEAGLSALRPVGNTRRLSVFERLGPRVKESSEKSVSTFDEDDDEFISKLQTTRKITAVPANPRMSLPANIKITPIKTPSSSFDVKWTDASNVLKQEDELANRMSRLSIMQRISSRNFEDSRLSTPIVPGNLSPSEIVFNNNLSVTNNNAPSDLNRPRMRTQHSFNVTTSISGTTRPRCSFAPSFRPNIPRFNQYRFVSNVSLPWQSTENQVITVETTVDHRIREDDLKDQEVELLSETLVDVPSDLNTTNPNKEEIVDVSSNLNTTNPSKEEIVDVPSYLNTTNPSKEEIVFQSSYEPIIDKTEIPAVTLDIFDGTNDLYLNIPKTIKTEPKKQQKNVPYLKIPKFSDVPQLESFLDVKICHIIDPFCFYIQPFKSKPILNSLMGKIQQKYSQKHNPCSLEDIYPNGYFALKHQDDYYYRVQVTDFASATQVTVFFCDFGYQVDVSVKDLITLEPEFYEIPYQAVRAYLSGIKPNNDKWTLEETKYFLFRVHEKPFVSHVANIDHGKELVLGLVLFDTSGDDDVNIGREMVEKYYARYIPDV